MRAAQRRMYLPVVDHNQVGNLPMTYEEALERSGADGQPTWVLRDILERLSFEDVQARAIRLLLKQRTK